MPKQQNYSHRLWDKENEAHLATWNFCHRPSPTIIAFSILQYALNLNLRLLQALTIEMRHPNFLLQFHLDLMCLWRRSPISTNARKKTWFGSSTSIWSSICESFQHRIQFFQYAWTVLSQETHVTPQKSLLYTHLEFAIPQLNQNFSVWITLEGTTTCLLEKLFNGTFSALRNQPSCMRDGSRCERFQDDNSKANSSNVTWPTETPVTTCVQNDTLCFYHETSPLPSRTNLNLNHWSIHADIESCIDQIFVMLLKIQDVSWGASSRYTAESLWDHPNAIWMLPLWKRCQVIRDQ